MESPGSLPKIPTVVLRLMPFARGHFGQKLLHFGRVGNELAVEVAGIPVDQHAAEIEDSDRSSGRSVFWGQSRAFLRAIFRAYLANKIKALNRA